MKFITLGFIGTFSTKHQKKGDKTMELTERQARKLAKILDEVTEFPDGSLKFYKHFKSKDESIIGWYAIQKTK